MKWELKPSGTRWTDEQWHAISLQGDNLLIAAAAGSGKTAVLVERIIRRISADTDPIDVDRLLVATFTNAAAAEMRQRIREALEEKLTEQPHSTHIKRQLSLIHRASITTVHSFCMDVIRRYYQLIHIDPSFRIGNETEMALLRQDALEVMFEHYYATSEEESHFWQLVDSYSGERTDDALFHLVLRLYDFSRSHPSPERWLNEMANACSQQEQHQIWFECLRQDVKLSLAGALDLLTEALQIAALPGGPAAYIDTLQEDYNMVKELYDVANDADWQQVYAAFQHLAFSRLKSARGEDIDKSIQETVKDLRDQVKKQLLDVKESTCHRSPEQYEAEMIAIAPLMQMLVELVNAFAEQYRAMKVAKGLLDFNDLEHYCLQILCDPDAPPGELRPSAAALEYQEQFVEILLDEYQDTNQVQEAIISLLSRTEQGNRFMVGDVKQSIYRFRLAEPALFLEKYDRYTPFATIMSAMEDRGDTWQEEGSKFEVPAAPHGVVIDLADNFRSSEQVVDGVNFIFEQIMQKSIGEIDYDEQAKLKFAAHYLNQHSTDIEGVNHDRTIDVCLIDKSVGSMTEAEGQSEGVSDDVSLAASDLETVQLEARLIAAKIKDMMGSTGEPLLVVDQTTQALRPVTYRDMVILLRATKQWAPIMLEELKQAGIPCYAELSTGYFSSGEIEIILSLLQIIDNPLQDIPLAAVLRSPIYQLSAEELAQIRVLLKGAPFYEAVWHYAEAKEVYNPPLQQKIKRFIAELEEWREAARFGSLSELILRLYQETGYYDIVGGMAGGVQRQANLRALYDRAKQYEATSFRGLFRFLRFIDRMRESGGDLGTARALGEQEDVVRIVSIHRSKGLEYPVVFAAGLARRFNRQDLSSDFLIHKSLGFGPKYVDNERRVSYPTLANLAIKRTMHDELQAEELRVLYVALTRAKEKLVLIGTSRDLTKQLQDWTQVLRKSDPVLPEYMIAAASSFMDWIGPALLRHPDFSHVLHERLGIKVTEQQLLNDASSWSVSCHTAAEFVVEREEQMSEEADDQEAVLNVLAAVEPVPVQQSPWHDMVKHRLAWSYPYKQAGTFFSKTSVSEMKRLASLESINQLLELDESGTHHLLDAEGEWLADETMSEAMIGYKGEWPDGLLDEAMAEAAAGRVAEQAESLPSIAGAFHKPLLRRPRFLEERKMTAAERGTLYHAVMQYIPLNTVVTREEIEHCIAKMVRCQFMTEEQSKQIEPTILETFFSSPLGQRLLQAKQVYREIPFSYAMRAKDVYPHVDEQTANEEVLIQGVIDCLFEDEQGLVLLDYKTDAVYGNQLKRIRDRYQLQVNLYAKAVESIWKKPVVDKILFLFDGGHIITM